ncbi:hypothetical protein K432DRAFT_363637 [Lepidopterella palustris CBS 459.81]|uniref:Major facilitator superfamily (MFS) profile domain-containing protein n=1 Tax=Lepidopterella palustris CBS 459.81 TaxID=1314670 RepID=A0A8E2DZ38_9PEZI|nr:hypothetical protein K432DRAFT_363637 [Lepidopterella palustris CBS 459.81]
MVCGVNSDLFGRRWFIIFGNMAVFVGGIIGGTAKTNSALIAAMAITGFGGGNCQLAAFALPELLPNKYRPAAVGLVDAANYINLIVGPVAAQYAVKHGAWRWLLYALSIVIGGSGIGLIALYFPPKHPRGIPWRQALRELDYVGAMAFTAAANLILSGIIYASYIPASSPKVVGLLTVGFATLIFFGCWETFMPLKQPLTPSRIFRHNYGRTFTAPFIASMLVSMFYLGILTVWGTMVDVFFTSPTTGNKSLELSLAQGFGILLGATAMSTLGQWIKYWKWQMFGSLFTTTLFGGLLALGNPSRQGMCIAFAFLASAGYGWGQYLSIAYVQFGADQVELGIAGGLAGVARYSGGAIAQTVYVTVLSNTVTSNAHTKVISAAIAAGASMQTAEKVLAALHLGSAAIANVPGITTAIAEAAGAAYVASYVVALRTVALVSVAFGVVGVIACLCLEDITPKMTKKIEVFLENDVNAEKNKFH